MKTQQPPSAPEIEYALLAAMFVRENQRSKIFESIISGDFYFTANQIIYEKGRELYFNGQPIEIGSVWAALNEDERSTLGSATKLSTS